MSNREWEKAGEIGWETYYRWVEGRDLRQVFVDALPLLPEADGDRARVAIDLGCGDGKEALVLLERGWTVLAVDGAPEGIARLVDAVPPEFQHPEFRYSFDVPPCCHWCKVPERHS